MLTDCVYTACLLGVLPQVFAALAGMLPRQPLMFDMPSQQSVCPRGSHIFPLAGHRR